MNKPNFYEEAQTLGEFTPIALGGHKLTIMKVEECTTQFGNQYIKVYFDTTRDDTQPNYFAMQYRQDNRTEKKWSGVTTVFPTDNEGKTSRAFKTFCTSVEKSNSGFKIVWGEQFCKALENKVVGGVFGEEEYYNNSGELKTARKLFWFRSIEGIADADIPKKRTIDSTESPAVAIPAATQSANNWENIDGDTLPF